MPGWKCPTRCWKSTPRTEIRQPLLVLTANRGLCGGYNGNVIRSGGGTARRNARWTWLREFHPGRFRQAGNLGFQVPRRRSSNQEFLQFDDQPAFDEVEKIANGYLQTVHCRRTRSSRRGLHPVSLHRQTNRGGRNPAAHGFPNGEECPKHRSITNKQAMKSVYEFVPSAQQHPGRSGSHQLQGQAVQVFSGCGSQ